MTLHYRSSLLFCLTISVVLYPWNIWVSDLCGTSISLAKRARKVSHGQERKRKICQILYTVVAFDCDICPIPPKCWEATDQTMSQRKVSLKRLCFSWTNFEIIDARLSLRCLLWVAYSLPCFALFSCVGLSVIKDFERSTRTHCKVFNFLPSISAAIGDCEPQRYIWRFCFALDSVPRYLIGYLQLLRVLQRHHVAYPELYSLVQIGNSTLHFLELTFLLLLTYVSSSDIKWIHECSFIGFMVCSLLHMLCTVLIDYFWRRTTITPLTEQEKRLRSKRRRWFLINILSFFASLYFYFRHNSQCETNIYSMYCFFEYVVVLTNIAYHAVIMEEWDQQGGQIQFFY